MFVSIGNPLAKCQITHYDTAGAMMNTALTNIFLAIHTRSLCLAALPNAPQHQFLIHINMRSGFRKQASLY